MPETLFDNAASAGIDSTAPLPHVDIFSDGSSRGNPGPGGYGSILRFVDAKGETHERELSAGYIETTNNRMELMGVIVALETLKTPCEVLVTTDSQYVVKAFTEKWLEGWASRGWKTSSRKPVKNTDLWKRLLAAMEPHRVSWTWVEGHAGHLENERCDALATSAADADCKLVDTGFEGAQQA